MEICGNCDWASGGAIKYVFCEKRMDLVPIASKCPKWRIRVLPEGFLFKSDIIDLSHINPDELPVILPVELVNEEPPPPPQKRKRAPNKPKVIPTPPVPVPTSDEDEEIFA